MISPRPQQCYANAQQAVAAIDGFYNLTYFEGYVLVDTMVLAHAWVELDEKIVELTFPEGPEPDMEHTYLGKAFSTEDVRRQAFNEEMANPLAG